MISFLAAFLTFLPSFLWNFLQVYILRVFLSFARKISQNSSLRKETLFSAPHRKHIVVSFFRFPGQHHNRGVLTIWQSVPDHTCQSPRRDCYNPSSRRVSDNRMAWQQGASCHNTTCNAVHSAAGLARSTHHMWEKGGKTTNQKLHHWCKSGKWELAAPSLNVVENWDNDCSEMRRSEERNSTLTHSVKLILSRNVFGIPIFHKKIKKLAVSFFLDSSVTTQTACGLSRTTCRISLKKNFFMTHKIQNEKEGKSISQSKFDTVSLQS